LDPVPPAIVLALVAAAIAAVNLMVSWRYGWVFAAACLLFALPLALRAWFIRWMTEIAITDGRDLCPLVHPAAFGRSAYGQDQKR